MKRLLPAVLLSALAASAAALAFAADDADVIVPPEPHEAINPAEGEESASIVLGGGCFWCTELAFENTRGVSDVVSGYAGGAADDADYKRVAAGQTDHAEVIQVTYDPGEVTLGDLFRVFFLSHDPTQLDRQGPDVGRQYRSAIFPADDAQKEAAQKYLIQLRESALYAEPVVTTVEDLGEFHPAEEYHQDYVANNPEHPYVVQYAYPKVEKLKRHLPDLYEAAE